MTSTLTADELDALVYGTDGSPDEPETCDRAIEHGDRDYIRCCKLATCIIATPPVREWPACDEHLAEMLAACPGLIYRRIGGA